MESSVFKMRLDSLYAGMTTERCGLGFISIWYQAVAVFLFEKTKNLYPKKFQNKTTAVPHNAPPFAKSERETKGSK